MMDHDLVQMKMLVECGEIIAHHEEIARDELLDETPVTARMPAEVGP